LCGYFAPKGIPVDVVDERALAVDLHDRQPLPVPGLELRIAADVDLLHGEGHFAANGLEDLPRALAEMTTLRVVEDDLMDRCRA
jgi:hypothetical protein